MMYSASFGSQRWDFERSPGCPLRLASIVPIRENFS
ncbi:hypothetical protein PC128_g11619 [Phytophthora cactorum]|nr:hypothetical protein PC120_g21502 [Phytophthora cactorum]KAG3189811.1 hypothetical protein PC128_g11619 [Phytophthora cactorum]KAG4043819.1 hypothetical protein PC123_g20717 [Phytophthora cactorum]